MLPKIFIGQASKTNHKVPLTNGDYCQIEMRHRDSRFRSHNENWCFKVKIMQALQVSSRACPTMRNIPGKPQNARELKNGGDFQFMHTNKTFEFLKNRGYHKRTTQI